MKTLPELKVLTGRAVTGFDVCNVPDHMRAGIVRFYEHGIEPGGFLTSVIDNDLSSAVARADDINVNRLKNFIQWFYNYAPSGTWGYPGAVRDYLKNFHNPQEPLIRSEE